MRPGVECIVRQVSLKFDGTKELRLANTARLAKLGAEKRRGVTHVMTSISPSYLLYMCPQGIVMPTAAMGRYFTLCT